MPTSCATMNVSTPEGAMPAKVSVNDRAMVTAGLAKDVEAVNQYADVMYRPTAYALEEQVLRVNPENAHSEQIESGVPQEAAVFLPRSERQPRAISGRRGEQAP
jgi:hypothetical protein